MKTKRIIGLCIKTIKSRATLKDYFSGKVVRFVCKMFKEFSQYER